MGHVRKSVYLTSWQMERHSRVPGEGMVVPWDCPKCRPDGGLTLIAGIQFP